MQRRDYSRATWHSHPLNPKTLSAETVDWIFMVDLLNFSFWTPPGETPYTVLLDGVAYTGYWSLCAAINRALREGIPATEPSWWAGAPTEALLHVFRSDSTTELPMLQDRIQLLRETGTILISKFGGSFRINILEASAGRALALINTLCLNFHSFLDVSSHLDDQPVFLLKRAQILVADLWACFGGEGWGRFVDIDALTIFADYRIPQQLEILGLLVMSPGLKERLRRGELLSVHSQEVVELRATSIWIAELLRREMVRRDPAQREGQLNAILLDFYLWDTAKDHNPAPLEQNFPIHRTRSLFY